MKKIISIILLILILALPITSCNDNLPDAETSNDISSEASIDTTAETTEKSTLESADTSSDTTVGTLKETEKDTETEEEIETGFEETYADGLIRLSKDGAPLYRVVRSQSAGAELKNRATALTKSLNDLDCDAAFELKTDTYPIPQYLEILIGNTSHTESKQVFKTLDVNGWAVRKIGGKIVICATTPQAFDSAISYFKSCVSVNADGDAVIDLENGGFTYNGEVGFFSDSKPLSSFVIVYDGLVNQATELKNKIKDVCKVDLPIKKASDEPSENEILIGDCNRSDAQIALSGVSKTTDGLIIKASGSKIILAGHSTVSTMVAVDTFINTYLYPEYSQTPQIAENTLKKYDSPFGDVSAKQQQAKGSEVRIMSFNVLSGLFCDITSESRKIQTSGTILAYMPDVIGFQEFDGYYQSEIRNLISENYEIILGRKNDNSVGYNGIAYNKKTVTLIDKGYVEYRKTAQGRNHKYLAYGVFMTKDTNELFALINLHWDATSNDYKMMQSEDTLALIADIRTRYSDCPIFVTGDYNTNRHSDYFKNLLENANMQTAGVSAANKVNGQYNTYHGIPLGTLPAVRDTSIDHIVHSANTDPLFYQVIIDLPALYASDHNPIIADFALN